MQSTCLLFHAHGSNTKAISLLRFLWAVNWSWDQLGIFSDDLTYGCSCGCSLTVLSWVSEKASCLSVVVVISPLLTHGLFTWRSQGSKGEEWERQRLLGLFVVEAWVSHKIFSTLYLMKQCMIRPNRKGIQISDSLKYFFYYFCISLITICESSWPDADAYLLMQLITDCDDEYMAAMMLRIVMMVVLLIFELLFVASELRLLFSLVCKIQVFHHKTLTGARSVFHLAPHCCTATKVGTMLRFPEQPTVWL